MKFENVKIKQMGALEILSLSFNDKEYEFEAPADFVRNEDDKNIVALTYSAINKIALAEGVNFECKEIIKPTYNSCTVLVVATNKEGTVRREALVGKNKDNLPNDAKTECDSLAFKKACVEAFLSLYGVPSSRFNIQSGTYAPKKGSGINMSAIDNEETSDNNDEISSHSPAVNTSETITSESNNSSETSTSSFASVTMPFGTKKGETIYSILASDGGLDYFTRLFAVNQAIKNNKAVSDAVFAYYEENGADEKQKENLDKIRDAISN